MIESQTKENASLFDLGATSGAQKVGEGFASRALNAIVDGVKTKYGEAQVLLGASFSRYLENASQRYNQVKTLATGPTSRSIIGQDNIYVKVGVRFGKKEIDTDTVDSILRLSKNVVVLGTGGIGKSMLIRYLFLNTANRGEYVPILIELRRASDQEEISIIDLVYSCMKNFDVELPREQFEYSLRLGKYLFFMDGFDEIKESQAKATADAIQVFCAKYPKNPCIITSRPRRDISPLETFTTVELLPLSKEQAVSLASKIWKKDEKAIEFCRQLEQELYDKHRDFAENPLLLSMMFLTFMRNTSIPNHLVEFYSKAYDALYNIHDSNDKGYYRREFKTKELDEVTFRLLLWHCCFQTYFKQIYEFSREQLIFYLEKSISKLNLKNVKARDYLEDLCNIVCIFVEDGDIYRFSHRSFQTYFAACYTANILTDEQQKKLFAVSISGENLFFGKEDYYRLLFQIEPQRFATNALEEELRSIKKTIEQDSNPHICILRMMYEGVMLGVENEEDIFVGIMREDINRNGMRYFNIVKIFEWIVCRNVHNFGTSMSAENKIINDCIQKLNPENRNNKLYSFYFDFEMFDNSQHFDNEEKRRMYDSLAKLFFLDETYIAIRKWLEKLDEQRQLLSQSNFIDDL